MISVPALHRRADPSERVTAPEGVRERMGAWAPLLLMLPVALLVSVIYIRRTYVDVVLLDGFANVRFVDEVLDGRASVSDLTSQPFFGEHLYLGYRAIMVLNAKLFGLDMRL